MAVITWDADGEKRYELGCDKGVLYPSVSGAYPLGVAWNGLSSVTQSPSGADENEFYADNQKYGSIRGAEKFGATIECYTYPDEWKACDGHATPVEGVSLNLQTRKAFGLCYRSKIGNDTDGIDHGYKLNLIYNSSLMITLEYFDFYSKLLCFILNHVYQCFIIICSIYSFFPYSKKINIRTIHN